MHHALYGAMAQSTTSISPAGGHQDLTAERELGAEENPLPVSGAPHLVRRRAGSGAGLPETEVGLFDNVLGQHFLALEVQASVDTVPPVQIPRGLDLDCACDEVSERVDNGRAQPIETSRCEFPATAVGWRRCGRNAPRGKYV